MELPGRASHRDAFAASLLTSTFASLHIHSMSQNERVGRRGQVTSSNLHNLCMVTSSSPPGCERHYPPPPPPSQPECLPLLPSYLCRRASKQNGFGEQLCYVGCQGRTHRKWWATSKLYFPFLSMSSLPACLPFGY